MRELTARALDLAQRRGASYADIRIVQTREQRIIVKNGQIATLSEHTDQGFGVRVLVDGAWGFASSAELTAAEVDRVTAQALEIARASGRVNAHRVDLGPPEVHTGRYETPVVIDPFTIPWEQKVDLLLRADAEMRRTPQVKVSMASLEFIRVDKVFASTEGSFLEQTIIESGGGMECHAVGDNEVQKRSYPNSFGRHQVTGGWEAIEDMNLVAHGARLGEEAVALLSAPPCPEGVTTLILGPAQLALQLHESCGHPIELDRVLGTEAAFAGTSFLTLDKLGAFRYGSEVVNITADATTPGGLGTFGWDDEGVPAQRVPIVREGIFVGYLTSRETAALLGQRSSGAMRASGWNRLPIIRMTNINLEPGTWSFEDLLADTDHGIYMEMNKSWSIDDKRLNFQFGTEVAYEIKGGKLGQLYRNALYTGITSQFWQSCDAICNIDHWHVWGTPNCGKGQPIQVAHVGHGTAPARFRNVQVGHVKA
ncbi:MAG TPA: TldD/PmbA family protein [Caldilineae bacterium]|nr:TldD/PmbA family protein [Caldilineae bacterium]